MLMIDTAQITPFWEFICYGFSGLLSMPVILLLVENWRRPMSTILKVAAVLTSAIVLFIIIIYITLGPTPLANTIVGFADPVAYWVAFFFFVTFRDGRLVFTVITALLISVMTETLAGIIAPRGCAEWLVARILFSLAAFLLIKFLFQKPFHQMLHIVNVGWVKMSILPLSYLVLFIGGFLTPVSRDGDYRNWTIALILCVAVVLTYIAFEQLLRATRAQNNTQRDNSMLHAQVHFMEQQVKLMSDNDWDNRTYRHDMRHYLDLIQGHVRAGNIEGLGEILTRMETDLTRLSDHYTIRNYTDNFSINAILSLVEEQARAIHAEYTIKLELPASLPVDMVKLAVVLSNALENAINACKEIPGGQPRSIQVKGGNHKNQFFLTIMNTYHGTVILDAETGLPSTDQPDHGYGTQSIAAFANEYGAILSYRAEDGWFSLGILI